MRVTAIVVGAATFLIAHFIESRTWQSFGGNHAPWFLNSGRAVAFTAACFFVVAVAVGIVADRTRFLQNGVFLAVGGALASAFVLWRLGPGTLFPIAIGVSALILVISSVAGTGLSFLLTARRKR
jgi:hypothetical protein